MQTLADRALVSIEAQGDNSLGDLMPALGANLVVGSMYVAASAFQDVVADTGRKRKGVLVFAMQGYPAPGTPVQFTFGQGWNSVQLRVVTAKVGGSEEIETAAGCCTIA